MDRSTERTGKGRLIGRLACPIYAWRRRGIRPGRKAECTSKDRAVAAGVMLGHTEARVDRYMWGSRLSWAKELVKNTPRRSRASDRTNPFAGDLRGPAGGQACAR